MAYKQKSRRSNSPLNISRELSKGGPVIDETAQDSALPYKSPLSFMTKHSQSSPLNATTILEPNKTGDELKQEGKDLKKEGRDLKKEGRQKKRKERQAERKVKSGKRQLKRNLAENQKQIDKDKKSKELTDMPLTDDTMGNVTGGRKVTKTKVITKEGGKRKVEKTKTVTR